MGAKGLDTADTGRPDGPHGAATVRPRSDARARRVFTGTVVNVATVLVGSSIGALAGARLPARLQQTVLGGLGLLTLALGVRESLAVDSFITVLAAVLLGAVVGEALRLEQGLERLGVWLQARLGVEDVGVDPDLASPLDAPQRSEAPSEDEAPSGRFARGFVVATLVFCIGPLTLLGSIADGLGDPELLLVKAGLDGFASLAFAAVYGWGVALSALSVLVIQGGIAATAGALDAVLTEPMVEVLTATGGVLLLGVALRLLDVRHLRVANLLPALVVGPVLVAVTGGGA